MNLIRLLQLIGKNSLRRLLGGSAASSLCTTIVLAVVTYAGQVIAETKEDFVDLKLAAIFVASVVLYVFAESRMVSNLASDMEEAVDRLRMKLVRLLRHAGLWKVEHFGEGRLFDSISQSCRVISSNSQYLAQTMRNIVLTVTILLFIAWISIVAFIFLSLLIVIAAIVYYRYGLVLEARQEALAEQEMKLFENVSDLFDGFKEQRLSSARSRAINETFVGLSADTVTARGEVHQRGWQQFVFGETVFNLMLGGIVFVAPTYAPSITPQVVKITAAILFMVAPLFGLMQSLAVMRAAEAAAGRMMALEGELADLTEPGSQEPADPVPADFSEIRLEDAEFSFPAVEGEIPFQVGPVNLTIRRGEVIFVTGGNGSGKSTFIKLLTGLYHPKRGRLTIDGLPIIQSRLAAYRELMAAVFSDFHMFDRLYGIEGFDRQEAERLLRWMEMEKVTGLKEDRFTRADLSTGQRKRLALVAALLETKPILILDEWAADQDSPFRKKFYREIIPELKQRGLTIIAVTHDDRYFDAADRRWHLEEGRLTEPRVVGEEIG